MNVSPRTRPSLSNRRPVATYSIIARDPETGELGVAVQSHWFSVGTIVSWAAAGVGAVATQSLVDPAYGPNGLKLLRADEPAPEALHLRRAVRQVAMIDSRGRVAAHTGSRCIAAAGHLVDTDHQFSVQANMMENESVWSAMADAYRAADGDLADRLITALRAAEGAGGDIRGRQSAALLVVRGESTGRPWEDRRFDLRVEDHADPVDELARLVTLRRAYLHMNAGDAAIERGDMATARSEYEAAGALAPEIDEIPFWRAVTLAAGGALEDALPIFREVFARDSRWADLVTRLVPSGILPDDDAMLARILAERGGGD